MFGSLSIGYSDPHHRCSRAPPTSPHPPPLGATSRAVLSTIDGIGRVDPVARLFTACLSPIRSFVVFGGRSLASDSNGRTPRCPGRTRTSPPIGGRPGGNEDVVLVPPGTRCPPFAVGRPPSPCCDGMERGALGRWLQLCSTTRLRFEWHPTKLHSIVEAYAHVQAWRACNSFLSPPQPCGSS